MVVGEARELLAHLVQRGVVEAGVAEAARRRALDQQRGDAPPRRRREAVGTQPAHRGIGVEGSARRCRRRPANRRGRTRPGSSAGRRRAAPGIRQRPPAAAALPARRGGRRHAAAAPRPASAAARARRSRPRRRRARGLARVAARGLRRRRRARSAARTRRSSGCRSSGFGGAQGLRGSRAGSVRGVGISSLVGGGSRCRPPCNASPARRDRPAPSQLLQHRAACARPGSAPGRARAVRSAPKCSGEVAVRKRPYAGVLGAAEHRVGLGAARVLGQHLREAAVRAPQQRAVGEARRPPRPACAREPGPQRGGDQLACAHSGRPRRRASWPSAAAAARQRRPASRWRAAAPATAGR